MPNLAALYEREPITLREYERRLPKLIAFLLVLAGSVTLWALILIPLLLMELL